MYKCVSGVSSVTGHLQVNTSVAAKCFLMCKTQQTVVDRGSRSDRPRYRAHTRWTPPLSLVSAASRRTPRRATEPHSSRLLSTHEQTHRTTCRIYARRAGYAVEKILAVHTTTRRPYHHPIIMSSMAYRAIVLLLYAILSRTPTL